MRKYILKDQKPVRCDSLEEWGQWMQTADRRVRRTELSTGVVISTVFLGLDHNFLDRGPPHLFETLVFGGEHAYEMMRYATWDEAVQGHLRMASKHLKFEVIKGGKSA